MQPVECLAASQTKKRDYFFCIIYASMLMSLLRNETLLVTQLLSISSWVCLCGVLGGSLHSVFPHNQWYFTMGCTPGTQPIDHWSAASTAGLPSMAIHPAKSIGLQFRSHVAKNDKQGSLFLQIRQFVCSLSLLSAALMSVCGAMLVADSPTQTVLIALPSILMSLVTHPSSSFHHRSYHLCLWSKAAHVDHVFCICRSFAARQIYVWVPC